MSNQSQNQNQEKEKRADELTLANKELAFQNEEKDKRADELTLANKEKEKRADELVLANKELAFQNEEKDKRADELTLANKEKEKRADELVLANKELAFQNEEKDKRADELFLANKEKEKKADELVLANEELAFQNEEKDKRADELTLANKEKEKRADELVLANKELAFQNEEKDKRADELILANKEKEKRADELVLANKEKEKRAEELALANQELVFQKRLDSYRSETERVAQDLTLLIDTANAPIFGIDAKGNVNEWNQKSAEITGFNSEEAMGKNLVEDFIRENYRKSVNGVLQKALRGHNTSNFEFPLYTKNNKLVWVLLNATTRRNADGGIVGVVGVGQDITEIDGYRSEMERVAEDLTQLIDTANAPIFGIDAEGNVNEWNQKSAEITGFDADEVMGKSLVEDFIRENYRESVNDVFQKALKGDNTSNFEFPLYTKDNNLVRVSLNATTRRNAKGGIVGVIGVGQDITAENLARKESERTSGELTQLIDTANAPIFGIDAAFRATEWNQSAVRISGFEKEEVLGRDLVQGFITEEYKDSVKGVFDKALRGEETANFEFPLYTKDGSRLDLLLNASTRRDLEGNIIGVIGVGQNITAENLARKESERSSGELTQLIDTANAPIFGIDAAGRVTEWNQSTVRISGFEKAEVLGRDLVQDFITEEYKASVKVVLDNALGGEETANFEFPLYTKGGSRLDVLLNASTRRDLEGNIIGVIGVGQDITSENLARKESERTSSELTQLIDTANAPIFGIDAEGRVTEWNQSAARITGFEKQEVLGRYMVQDFITEEYKDSVKGVFDKALGGEETSNFEFPLYTKDEQRLEILLNASTRRDVEGKIVGVIGVGQDITSLKEKEFALQQSQKMEAVGQLTGGLAHDFNNLLSIVQGNLRFLQEDLGTVSNEITLLFEDALSAVEDGVELTGRLLQFSSNRNLQPRMQDVNEAMEKFYRLMSRTIGEKISLDLRLPEESLSVSVDPSQLENALLNLVINARDAMPRGGQINITAEKMSNEKTKQQVKQTEMNELTNKDFVKISVCDQGEGINPNIIDRITEPFFTTKDVGAGTGLGLSMVYSFLKTSGGFLRINSEVGEGTAVEMYFPSMGEVKTASPMEVSTSRKSNFSKTILVVEDEPRVRRVTVRDLRGLNYKTIEAGNADMAVSIIQSGVEIDLMFSDILMPGDMDGRMLGDWVKEYYPEIKVVLTSGYSKGKGDAKKPLSNEDLTKYAVVRKPYRINLLAESIQATFDET